MLRCMDGQTHMHGSEPGSKILSFGPFEVDLRACELRKHGIRIKLQEKPYQILVLLLERPGEVVPRERLRHELWDPDTFVDFDQSLNSAMKKLRQALGDSAESPRFVETQARRGYRFLAPVQAVPPAPEIPEPAINVTPPRIPWGLAAGVLLAIAILAVGTLWYFRNRVSPRPGPIQSIAVLPLANLSGNPDQDFFADGLTDALIGDLARIGALRVISRTSAMQ